MEEFRPIQGFEKYEVTSYGRVFNKTTGREMKLSPNTQGELTVGLVRDYHQTRFSVKCLVAVEFVPGQTSIFNTPIILDGDVHNLNASNIVWRPRWFAWKYKRQFQISPPWYTSMRVMDLTTQVEYPDIVSAAIDNGLLCADILESVYNERIVFPTSQLFVYII